AEIIADVVSQIRAAISTGNTLDQDKTKVPNSLKKLALRMITRDLKDYLELALTPDEQKQADRDTKYLAQVNAEKIRFEIPDTPAADAEMQKGMSFEQTTGAATQGKPAQSATRDTLGG